MNNKDLEWMLGLLMNLSGLPQFPTNDAALVATARAYLRIIHTENPKLDTVTHDGVNGGRLTNPGEWLIESLLESCERFPSPIVARRYYEQFFPTGDRRSAAELSGKLERE